MAGVAGSIDPSTGKGERRILSRGVRRSLLTDRLKYAILPVQFLVKGNDATMITMTTMYDVTITDPAGVLPERLTLRLESDDVATPLWNEIAARVPHLDRSLVQVHVGSGLGSVTYVVAGRRTVAGLLLERV